MAIYIKPSHRGLFKAKAQKAGMSTAAYAANVLASGSKASASTRKQAQFAKNAAGWSKKK